MENTKNTTPVNYDLTQTFFIGFVEKEGDYEITDEKTGKVNKGHYHNVIISTVEPYATVDKNRIGYFGSECNSYKMKYDDFIYVVGCTPETFDPTIFAGWFMKPINILFDKKGNIKSLLPVV